MESEGRTSSARVCHVVLQRKSLGRVTLFVYQTDFKGSLSLSHSLQRESLCDNRRGISNFRAVGLARGVAGGAGAQRLKAKGTKHDSCTTGKHIKNNKHHPSSDNDENGGRPKELGASCRPWSCATATCTTFLLFRPGNW